MSERKSQSARTNGAKSKGPVTPAGKRRSSLNSLSHGFSSKCVVLPGESEEEFQTLRQSYIDQFQPADPVELDLVETMAVSRWRLRRLVTLETNIIELELLEVADDIPCYCPKPGPDAPLAYAFRRVANGQQSLAMLARYESTLHRSFDRAFKQLQILRGTPVGSLRKTGLQPVPPESPSAPSAILDNSVVAPELSSGTLRRAPRPAAGPHPQAGDQHLRHPYRPHHPAVSGLHATSRRHEYRAQR